MRPEKIYHQVVTYWAPNGFDEFGKPLFLAPVQFKGRWEDATMEAVDSKGQEMTSKALVGVPRIQPISFDGYMFLGTSHDINPLEVEFAYQIRQINRTPDIRAMAVQIIAVL
jgi:hypothetical protein